jgi:PBP1b-binding outer membrane lipoprotein LpoB
MKVLKKITAIASIAVFGIWFSGCAGKPITFKSVDPKQYEEVKDKGHCILSTRV